MSYTKTTYWFTENTYPSTFQTSFTFFPLNKSEVIPSSYFFNINTSIFKQDLITILTHHTPKTMIDPEYDEWQDQLHSHSALNIKFNSSTYVLFQKRLSYAVSNICTYIQKFCDERNKLVADTRKAKADSRKFNIGLHIFCVNLL